MHSLEDLGWSPLFWADVAPGERIGRVAAHFQDIHRVIGPFEDVLAPVAGRLRQSGDTYPAIGDWVVLGEGIIIRVLPRRSRFVRKTAGATSASQVVAANVDVVFVVAGLDGDFNLGRIERYLAVAWCSGAQPVVLLNKADLCADPDAAADRVRAVAPGVPVHWLSARSGEGLDGIATYLRPGLTAVLVGSSGVGKSTALNALYGVEIKAVRDVRASDGRGRHATTHRELTVLPGGGLIIDTPGMRELGLLEGDLAQAFEDVAALARTCRFRDCRHEAEPGCAVRDRMDPRRLASLAKLRRELAHHERRARALETAGAHPKRRRAPPAGYN